jgi:hypothetical protein
MSVRTGSITRRRHLRKRCLVPRRDGGGWADRPARPVFSVENLGVVRVVPDAGGRAGRLALRAMASAEGSRDVEYNTAVRWLACVRAIRPRGSQPDDMMLNRTPDPGRPPCCPGRVPTTWPTAPYQRQMNAPRNLDQSNFDGRKQATP